MARTWPADWESRISGAGCPMCASLGAADNGFGVLIRSGGQADAFLQRAVLARGYTTVIWKHGHAVELTELSGQALAEYWRDVTEVARAIERYYRPAKMNYVTLGNVVPHLHTHIVPRYLDDPCPGGPLPMDASRNGRLPEARFQAEAEELRRLAAGE